MTGTMGTPASTANTNPPFLEWPQLSVCAARPFWENHHRCPLLNGFCGSVKTLEGRTAIEPVNADVTGAAHAAPEQWDFEQLRFSQPSELHWQLAEQNGDIIVALVVAHEDAGPLLQAIFQSTEMNANTAHPQDGPSPHLGHVVHGVAVPGKKGDGNGQGTN
jgi:hypothetical protein